MDNGDAWETYPLTDGGTLSALKPQEVLPVGEHGVCAKMRYGHPGGENQPALEIGIDVRDGVPVCTEIRLLASDSGEVRVKDLTLLAGILGSRIRELAVIGAWDRTDRGWGTASPLSAGQERVREQSVRTARQAAAQASRRKVADLLPQVAEVYTAADGNKLGVIQQAFDVSGRTAARYVSAARKAGLLDG